MKTTDFAKKAYSIAKDFALKMQKKNIDTCAGSTSFFIILSIIPLLILLTGCLSFTAATEEDLMHAINDLVPPFAQGFMVRLVNETASRGLILCSCVVYLFHDLCSTR